MLRSDVVALYVDPRGPYPKLLAEGHWYDEARDARTYAGPWPVVAHPPCGPWGRLKHLCTKQPAWCGPHAVATVRRWGGVLEHPAGSTLWRACSLPRPGELPDAHGGSSYAVRQVSWGHGCIKPTWLYVVGVAWRWMVATQRSGGTPTHRLTNGPRGPSARGDLIRASAEQRRRTPIAFAEWLISLAAQARRTEAA